jgi:hypothetical protein
MTTAQDVRTLIFCFWPVFVIELNRAGHRSDGGVVWKGTVSCYKFHLSIQKFDLLLNFLF